MAAIIGRGFLAWGLQKTFPHSRFYITHYVNFSQCCAPYARRSRPCAALAVCLCARAAVRHKARGGPPLPARRAGLIFILAAKRKNGFT
jgi:hypothetical protein